MKLPNDYVETLQEIASMKRITVEEAANQVLSLYSRQYLRMLKDARKAADNAIQRNKKGLR